MKPPSWKQLASSMQQGLSEFYAGFDRLSLIEKNRLCTVLRSRVFEMQRVIENVEKTVKILQRQAKGTTSSSVYHDFCRLQVSFLEQVIAKLQYEIEKEIEDMRDECESYPN